MKNNKITWNSIVNVEPAKQRTLRLLYKNFKEVISKDTEDTNFFEYIFAKYNLQDDLDQAKLIACFTEIDLNKLEDGSLDYDIAIEIGKKWGVKEILEAEETDRLMDIYCIEEEEKHIIS